MMCYTETARIACIQDVCTSGLFQHFFALPTNRCYTYLGVFIQHNNKHMLRFLCCGFIFSLHDFEHLKSHRLDKHAICHWCCKHWYNNIIFPYCPHSSIWYILMWKCSHYLLMLFKTIVIFHKYMGSWQIAVKNVKDHFGGRTAHIYVVWRLIFEKI